MSEDAGIVPRTVATVRRSNHSARSFPQLGLDLIHNLLDIIHCRLDLIPSHHQLCSHLPMNKYSTHYPTDFLPKSSNSSSQKQQFIFPKAAIHLSKNSNLSSEKFQFIFPRAAIRLLVTRSLPINSNKQSSNHPYIHFPIIQHDIFPSPAINLSITWSLIFSLQAVNILFTNS